MTLATGSRISILPGAVSRAGKQNGFTLLEVLVVLAIAGIIAGGAALGIGRSAGSQVRDEAKKLYLQMKLAREDAVLLNRQRGLSISQNDNDRYRYRWLQYDEDSEVWNDFSETGYRNSILPANILLELEVMDSEINLRGDGGIWRDPDEEDQQRTPNMMFLSSGESTPFSLRLALDGVADSAYVISSKLIGKISMRREGEVEP